MAKKTGAKGDDSVLSRDRVTRAVVELKKYLERKEAEDEKTQLLEDESLGDMHLLFSNLDSVTGSKKNFKLKLVDVKHSLYAKWKDASATEVKDFKTLLILKDSDVSKVTADELYDNLKDSNIAIDEIICGKDLKTKYKAFEARAAFVSQFSLILSDDSVVTALPKLLGGKAYNKVETTPIPIRTNIKGHFSLTSLVNQIKKIYLTKLPLKQPRGSLINVHMGRINWFSDDEIVDNIESVASALIKDHKIRSVMLKTTSSPPLPLYKNDKIIEEMVQEKETSEDDKSSKALVKIGDVEVELSAFDRALMEVANPQEYETLFAKQISQAKRKRSSDDIEEKKEQPSVKKQNTRKEATSKKSAAPKKEAPKKTAAPKKEAASKKEAAAKKEAAPKKTNVKKEEKVAEEKPAAKKATAKKPAAKKEKAAPQKSKPATRKSTRTKK